jgi:hypothetical protein
MHTLSSWSNKLVFINRRSAMFYTPKRSFWGQAPPPDFDTTKDYYKILGVKKDATQAEVK